MLDRSDSVQPDFRPTFAGQVVTGSDKSLDRLEDLKALSAEDPVPFHPRFQTQPSSLRRGWCEELEEPATESEMRLQQVVNCTQHSWEIQ